MPTSNPASAAPPQQRLMRIFVALGDAERGTLLAFAEFLAAGGRASAPAPQLAPACDQTPSHDPACNPAQRPDQAQALPEEPRPLPRPERETIIAAIRRLTETYAMLDRGPMLHETAALMSAHVLHGRAAAAVIDDLEALFLRHYQVHRARRRVADPLDGGSAPN